MEDEPVLGIPHDVALRIEQGAAAAHEHALVDDVASAIGEYRGLVALLDDCEPTADTRFTQARLLSSIGELEYGRGGLAEAIDAYRRALDLIDATADATMGPKGRPLWLHTAVGILTRYADAVHKTADLPAAHALLDRADSYLAELGDDPASATLLADVRATLHIGAGDWARAEAILTAAIPHADPELVARLHTSLGRVFAITGRLDDADDQYRAAADAHEASPWEVPVAELAVDLADLAHRRGDLADAARRYREAAAALDRIGRDGDVAICQVSLAEIAMADDDGDTADALLTDSLRRFTKLGMALSAADTMLLIARRSFERGDMHTAEHYVRTARATFERLGARERCAQADYLLARAIEGAMVAEIYHGPEREAIDTALGLTLPAALYLESIRFDFTSSAARAQWLAVSTAAMDLAFRLALRRNDPGLIFELVEFRCAGAPLALASPVELSAAERFAEAIPRGDDDSAHALGRAAADAASTVGLRVGPPPGVIMSAGFGRIALNEYIDVARRRYRADIIDGERIPSW